MTICKCSVSTLGISVTCVLLVMLCVQAGFAAEKSPAFKVSKTRTHTEKIAASRKTFKIAMGGAADMDNTLTRHYYNFKVAFQPMISLTIANTGTAAVVNPRVVTNGLRRWWCMEELLKDILAGATDKQEKALRIWQFARSTRYHDSPILGGDELHDPVKMFNVFGAGLCSNSGATGRSLMVAAGLGTAGGGKDPLSRSLHGHVMCEAWINGAWQFLDIDQDVIHWDRENERIVSGDEVMRDHELATREGAFGPVFDPFAGQKAAAIFGSDDRMKKRGVASGHRIDMTLRPGERMIYRWDNVGKVASDKKRRRRYFGNSLHVYEPALSPVGGAKVAKDIVGASPKAAGARLAGGGKAAHLLYEVQLPYAVVGGRVKASFLGLDSGDRFEVACSLDGEQWTKAWEKRGAGAVEADVSFDKHWTPNNHAAIYRYLVRVTLSSAGKASANLKSLRLETDVMTWPLALPRLRVGANEVAYTDDTAGAREVTLTYRWRESGNVIPPPAPKPTFPAAGAVVAKSTFAFRWEPIAGAKRYHMQVSKYADMRVPYRTYFDTIVETPSHETRTNGMFSPGTDYYWRVRARNAAGMWGPWCEVRRFRWRGPRVPLDIKRQVRGNRITISWKPNPRGPRPVAYLVYGSDERGFPISKKPYKVISLAKPQPANFLARTEKTEMLVVAPDAGAANMNRSFYRVTAVDADGVESGCSDFVELPHPFIYSELVTAATAGKAYRCKIKTLRSMGDLQHRYGKSTKGFFELEGCEFSLAAGPKWLKLDPKTGVLSGTPARKDVGAVDVEVVAKRTYPRERTAGGNQWAAKSAARFQASGRRKFRITVGPG